METRNAIIERAVIKNDDRVGLTAILNLNYGGLCQNFGYFCLYQPNAGVRTVNAMGHFIYRVLEVAGVNSWDELAGKAVRVVCDAEHIEKIGHIVKDIWFDPDEEICAVAKFVTLLKESTVTAEK